MRALALAIVAAGCGRIAFEPRADATEPFVHTGTPRVLSYGTAPAFPAAMFDAWFTANTTSVTFVDSTAPVTPAFLADYDVVFVRLLERSYTSEEAAAFHDFVAAGNGVIALCGYDGVALEASRFTELVTPFAITAKQHVVEPTSMFDGPATLEPHPIATGIGTLPFIGGFELVLPPAASPLARVAGATVAGTLEVGRGRIVVWADDWVLFDAQWTASNERFWMQALAWVWPTS